MSNIKDYIDDNKHIIILLYMNGCIYCEKIKPVWNKIKNDLKIDNIKFVEIEKDELNKIKDINIGNNILGFPTIRYIHNNIVKEYDGDRSYKSLLEWINKNTEHKVGGKKRKNSILKFLHKRKTKRNNRKKSYKKNYKYNKTIKNK